MCVRVISSLTICTKVLEKILNGFKCGNCHIIRKIWQGKIDWFSSHRYIIPQNGPKIPPSITASRIGHAFNFFSVVIIRVMSTRFTEFNVERLNVSHKIGTYPKMNTKIPSNVPSPANRGKHIVSFFG